jgi:phosphonatase-like hydrolase
VIVDLVVFDMAGTTVHDGDAVHACLQAALGAAGIRVGREAINAVMGLPKPVAIRCLVEADAPGAEASDRLVEALHDDFVHRMLGHYRSDPSVREVDGALQVFRELRARGIKVALDTGFSRQIVDVILSRLGWGGHVVDATVASDEVTRGRPHPDLVWRAMALTGVRDPGRVAKVGDTPADLQEGQAAGCGLVVGVTEGSHTEDELRPWPHTHLVPNVGALPALIAALSRVSS